MKRIVDTARTGFGAFLGVALAGCASGNAGYGPTKAPADARTSMWSSRPAAELADCVGRQFGLAPVRQGDSYEFSLPGIGGMANYRIASVTERSVYVSQVTVFGSLLPNDQEARVSTCLLPQSPGAAAVTGSPSNRTD